MGGYLRNYRLQPTLGPWQGPGKNHAVTKTLPFWFNFHLCENLDERCRRSERSCQSCGGPPLVSCHGWKYMSLLPHTQVADKPLNKTGSCSDEWPAPLAMFDTHDQQTGTYLTESSQEKPWFIFCVVRKAFPNMCAHLVYQADNIKPSCQRSKLDQTK